LRLAFFSLTALPVTGRRLASPALESPAKGAQLRETEQEGDFAQGISVFLQIADRLFLANILYQALERLSLLLELAVQGMPAHVQLLGHHLCIQLAQGQML